MIRYNVHNNRPTTVILNILILQRRNFLALLEGSQEDIKEPDTERVLAKGQSLLPFPHLQTP